MHGHPIETCVHCEAHITDTVRIQDAAAAIIEHQLVSHRLIRYGDHYYSIVQYTKDFLKQMASNW